MRAATQGAPPPADSARSQLALEVEHVSKHYRLWKRPIDRLKYSLLGQLRSFLPYDDPSNPRRGLRARLEAHGARLFEEFAALQNVSLQLRRGESLGIIGLNGSGKSTLLQIIAGTLHPSGGRVIRHGRVAALLELGAGFNPEFTGRENVYLSAAIFGMEPREIDERFERIVEFAEIGAFIDEPVKTYSSGMAIRLGFAITTQVNADILVVDEALSVGDIYFQHKSMRHIRAFQAAGGSLLFVSHDPGAVKSLCDRAVLLDNGVLIREGKPDTVLDYYNAIIAKKEKDAEIQQVEAGSGAGGAARVQTRSGNLRATFASVELLDRRDRPARAFCAGEMVCIRCVVECHVPLAEATVGFIVRDRLGNDAYGTNTHNLRVSDGISHEAGGEFEVRFHLPLNLGYGSYSLTVAVHTGATHTQDNFQWLDNVLVFQVVPGSEPEFIGSSLLPVRAEITTPPVPAGPRGAAPDSAEKEYAAAGAFV